MNAQLLKTTKTTASIVAVTHVYNSSIHPCRGWQGTICTSYQPSYFPQPRYPASTLGLQWGLAERGYIEMAAAVALEKRIVQKTEDIDR